MRANQPSSWAPAPSSRGGRHTQTCRAVDGETDGLLSFLGGLCDALPESRGAKYKKAVDLVLREGEDH